ncbi:MAG: glycine cleavage T C-terminal barrel domain-containing protein [Actinomycetota bacterium]
MRRLETGGTSIDRSAPLAFTFGGSALRGFAGDTLASALLANGVDVVCPSPILGRPRGVMTAGPEEPSAFVEISAPELDLISAATTVELVDGLVAKGRPGTGRMRLEGAPPPRCEHRYAHCETLVVGAGPAGVAAAREAVAAGDRVILIDERSPHGVDLPEATVLARATALGLYDHGYVVVHERSRPVERLWHVRARRVILATGAHERPIAFAANDRPGVMLASSAAAYVERFGVVPGERAVVFTTNHGAYTAARALRNAGTGIAAIVDVLLEGSAQDAARADGFEVRSGWAIAGTEGDPRVSAVRLVGPGGEEETVKADLVAVSGGWNPVVQLWRAIGGGLRWDEALATFVPNGVGPSWLEVVGTATGEGLPTSAPYWYVPADDLSSHFVDFQRDQTVADVIDAVEGGLRSVEHVKRATYIGTAVDQGRTSGVLTAGIVNLLQGAGADAQGPTNARPPYTPVSFAALAGPHGGARLDPARTTSIHPWHADHGAVFENVGQWKRPWFFPRTGEDLDEAVRRECLAVRTGVGMMDASTLGKIEVVGPDAAVFLDRMYTNRMSNLAVGSIRYGLMCGLDGMVMDDGVAMRSAEDRYLVTTTTGGAAKVLDRFEEWLQTEWNDLRVYCTSVTEQWAVVAVNGPRARDVVAAAGTDIDLSAEAFPHMTLRHGTVAEAPARLARVSFSGELAYEVHVAARYGSHVWESLTGAGEPFGITAYGTEAMHVLRAEKGYVIVGQDTDGTLTPFDLGMSWIVNERKGDFIGRRSFRRADTAREDRKHLVGLLPLEPDALIPEGAQLVQEDTGRIPMPMVGHVTSSYRSAILERTFALAMLASGRERIGTTVFAPLPEGTVAATVTEPIFYDLEGARRDG